MRENEVVLKKTCVLISKKKDSNFETEKFLS